MATSGAYRSLANKEKQKLAPIFASLLHKKQAVNPRSDHQPWNVVISMPIRYSGGDSDPSLSWRSLALFSRAVEGGFDTVFKGGFFHGSISTH